jgi:hypothetical protein
LEETKIKVSGGRKSFLNDFFNFLFNPRQETKRDLTAYEKVKVIFYSFILLLVGAALSIAIKINFEKLQLIKNYKNLAVPLLNDKGIIIYLKVIFIGPLVEELAFRKLLKISKQNFALSVSFLSFIYLSEIFGSSYELNEVFILKVFVGVFLYVYCAEYLKVDKMILLEIIYSKYYAKVFYFTAISFGYLHLFNFGNISFDLLIASPVLVLMFIIYGIVFGYVRVTLGFYWGLALHIMLNIFISLIKAI